ncbi:ABC transporter ATP-binding protein [Allorhizobium borbori]|uniref:Branched-chain amino acid transport system ATP-binding protein n=1 Tax=Allorhizobium borbori TaxID=485907 RepID=A0A7W6K530_9HYPH|nr:ABC transporter ATP-binding protein [Allorhizobium borbori]MBB4105328.1 branched-chain amino acid transport system ATP-binding protein [Allorhizobium borbori]PZU25583.1 MAG: ABC transporter ATP-binding protein [Shinella sp.]
MTKDILRLEDLNKSFGPAHIIRGVNLAVHEGERHAVIGPNGAGKSTLFHLISGQFAPSSGRIVLDGEEIGGLEPATVNRKGLARSFQITNIFPGLTVFENIRLAVMRRHNVQFVLWRPVSGLKKVSAEVETLLEQVRLTARAQTLASQLSYSEQRSLEIGMTLASDPRVIILDEPMAGMSQEETDYTVGLIREITKGRTLMIVEHDMDVVFTLADRISVLVYGEIIATGTPKEIRENARVREAYLGEEVH